MFFCKGRPIARPEEIIPFLGGGARHWKKGRSAHELAHSWFAAQGLPAPVTQMLATVPEFAGARLIAAHFERDTALPGRGKASQTDLLALCEAESGTFVLGVEGKVDETLGPHVCDWDSGTPNRRTRLEGLAALLGADLATAAPLRYQLLHRTAATLIEARGLGAPRAVMLVQSFDPGHAWFEDFCHFTTWLGLPEPRLNQLTPELQRGGIGLRLGWCADRPAD